jgi:hypothetical protein
MTYRAKTTIQHGDGDSVHVFKAGDELTDGIFSSEHLADLLDADAIEGDAEGYTVAEDVEDEDDDEDVDLNSLTDADKDELGKGK